MGKSMSMDRSSDSCKGVGAHRLDHFDLELRRIDSSEGGDGLALADHYDHGHDPDHDHDHVRVDMHVAQEETRI